MDLLTAPEALSDVPGVDWAEPFTPMMAARGGVGRATLERAVRAGRVIRLVRGVYVDAEVPLTSVARARALALVVSRRHLVVDRTAAWVHGAPALRRGPTEVIPLDVFDRRRYTGTSMPVRPEEVTLIGGIRCTSGLRTAWDVACHFAPERALPLLDGLVRAGAVTHASLIDMAQGHAGLPGTAQACELAANTDGRALNPAESVLRMHWLGAQLPTPVPGWSLAGVRLALGLPTHCFGVVLSGQTTVEERHAVRRSGWTLLALNQERVRDSDAGAVSSHLEREFRRHLLEQMG